MIFCYLVLPNGVKYMMNFETMNQMVYKGEQRPDDLCLFEQVAWEGLEYVYALLGMRIRSRMECAAIKEQIGREYKNHIRQFEKLDNELSEALAVWKLVKKSDDPAVKALLQEVLGTGTSGA